MKYKFEWIYGAIPTTVLVNQIEFIHSLENAGAIDIFLGQIRADEINNQKVSSIYYTSYQLMANTAMEQIITQTMAKHNLIYVFVAHSLDNVKVGELSLMVVSASKHRAQVLDANREIVERIKKEVSIWGEELVENGDKIWKINT